jgi:hypothetical protein
VRFHIAPFEGNAPPDLVVGQVSAFHPVVHGANAFIEPQGDCLPMKPSAVAGGWFVAVTGAVSAIIFSVVVFVV